VHFSHAFSRGFNNVSIFAWTKAARCFEHPSSSLFQYWQLKSPKAFGARDHHIRRSVNVVAVPGNPSWSKFPLMGANPRPRCSNQSRNRFQEILGTLALREKAVGDHSRRHGIALIRTAHGHRYDLRETPTHYRKQLIT